MGEHRGYEYSPERQPDPHRARDVPGLPGAGRARRWRSPAGWPPRTPCCACWARAITPSSRTTPTGARTGSSTRCGRRPGSRYTRRTSPTSTGVREAWQDRTRMVWIETPSNPLLSIVDIEAVAAFAHDRGALRGGGQHVRVALPAAAAAVGRGHRGALVDQVPGRPQRRRRRLRGHRRRRAGRADRVRPERGRRRSGADGLLPGAAGGQDAGPADGPPRRQRRRRGRAPRRTPRRRARSSTRACPTTPDTRSPAAR